MTERKEERERESARIRQRHTVNKREKRLEKNLTNKKRKINMA